MTAATGETNIRPSNARSRGAVPDHRGSWLPSGRMIAARWYELRKRRGLMLLLAGVTVGLPTVYLAIRLVLHAVAPHTYGPAGGYDGYVNLVAGVLYVFGFIVAATLGATAGSVDLTEGMFRHHVITGRSRLALYLARIPAGLGIILPLMAIGFTIVCAVSVFAAPSTLDYNGARVPAQLSRAELVHWATDHPNEVVNNFPLRINPGDLPNTACLPGPSGPDGRGAKAFPGSTTGPCTTAQLRALAVNVANESYDDYSRHFLSPSISLMVKSGLWIGLEAVVAFLIGLGLASLLGQRTVAVVLMIVLELILTPLAVRAHLPHLMNLQRAVIGAATAHVEPGGLPRPFGGSQTEQVLALHEPTGVAIVVIIAWIVVWTGLGAWRMSTRDA